MSTRYKGQFEIDFDNNWEHQFRNQIYTFAYCNLTIVVLFIVYVACPKIQHVITILCINAWCIQYKNELVTTKLLSQPSNNHNPMQFGMRLPP